MPLMTGKLLELFQLNRIWICGNYIYNTKFHWYILYFPASALQIFWDPSYLYIPIFADTNSDFSSY